MNFYLGSTGWKVPADEVEIYDKKIKITDEDANDLDVKEYYYLTTVEYLKPKSCQKF